MSSSVASDSPQKRITENEVKNPYGVNLLNE